MRSQYCPRFQFVSSNIIVQKLNVCALECLLLRPGLLQWNYVHVFVLR